MVEELILDDRGLSESARENFIGEVIEAKVEESQQFEGEQLHIQMQPLDGVYSAVQHEWYRPTKTVHSKYGVFVKALAKIGLRGIKPSDLEGQVFEWEYHEYETPAGDKKYAWVPIRKVSEQEVKLLQKKMDRNSV